MKKRIFDKLKKINLKTVGLRLLSRGYLTKCYDSKPNIFIATITVKLFEDLYNYLGANRNSDFYYGKLILNIGDMTSYSVVPGVIFSRKRNCPDC